MTKEELLEMVNATISGNGKQEITGKSLNLALTEIINAMGTGDSSGGGLMLHFLPDENFTGDYLQYVNPQDLETYEEYVKHNQEIYNILLECNTEHKPVPGPIYFDNTFFEWNYNKRENSVRGGIVTAWGTGSSDENGNPLFSFISLANGNTDYISLGMDGLIHFNN